MRYPQICCFSTFRRPHGLIFRVTGSMRNPKELPLHLALRPFTLAQARQARLSERRIRAGDLSKPSRGVRVPQTVDCELLDHCRPYTQLTGNSVVSHITAAKIHGLFLPSRFKDGQLLDLTRPTGCASPRWRHVKGHRLDLDRHDIDEIGGIPVTSAARTFLDIAPLLSLDELVIIGDQLVCSHQRINGRTKIAMVELPILLSYLARHAGARGMSKLKAAMMLVKVGVDSPPETRLRLLITRAGLPEFATNYKIKDPAGKPLVEPDLACPEYKTCTEYDGAHHDSLEQQANDRDRDFITQSSGWHQVVLRKEDMRNGGLIAVTKLARMLVRGGWSDPKNLARQSLQGALGVRKDFD